MLEHKLVLCDIILVIFLWKAILVHMLQSSHDSINYWKNGLLSKGSLMGIYHNRKLLDNLRSQKAVANVIVTEAGNPANGTSKLPSYYQHILRNHLCHLERFKSTIIVYIIGLNRSSLSIEEKHLRKEYHALTITLQLYPMDLFWRLVRQKSNNIIVGNGRASFAAEYPSFQHFGALVMLVPILEMLQYGINVLYMDSDAVMVQDAGKHIATLANESPDLDFIISQESRHCLFPSYYRINQKVTPLSFAHDTEPNTGIMFIRSNNASIAFFWNWLTRLVEENAMNDQKLLQSLFAERGAVRSAKCNFDRDPDPDPERKKSPTQSVRGESNSESPVTVTYCLLNEFQYQNGMMQFFCSLGRRDSSVSLYVLGMQQFSALASPGGSIVGLPMVMHPNYCNDKLQSLETAGLLLYNLSTNRCGVWNVTRTSFGSRNWTAALDAARQELHTLIGSAKQRWSRLHSQRSGQGPGRASLPCEVLLSLSFLQPLERLFCFADGQLRQFPSSIIPWAGVSEADFVVSSNQLWLAVPRGRDMQQQQPKSNRFRYTPGSPVLRLPVRSSSSAARQQQKRTSAPSPTPTVMPSVLPTYSPSTLVSFIFSIDSASPGWILQQGWQVLLVLVASASALWRWRRRAASSGLRRSLQDKILKGLSPTQGFEKR